MALIVAGSLSGCERPRDGDDSGATRARELDMGAAEVSFDRERAKRVIEKFECARCHTGSALSSIPRDRHCVRCHDDIRRGDFDVSPAVLSKWQSNIVDLRVTPSLVSMGRRFRREWLEAFLRDPVDLRPHMRATMPRLPITPADAALIAAALLADADANGNTAKPGLAPAPVTGDPGRGRALFAVKACGACHEFSGAETSRTNSTPPREPAAFGKVLAPDLRITRQRYRPEMLVPWLMDPASIKADTSMPTLGLSMAQAQDLAAYILRAPLAPSSLSAQASFERLPLLERPVGFAEVEKRVFKRTCWHCHSDPDFTGGDGGPGNTGGFGFPPRGVNLADHASVASGALDDSGRRRSLFRENASGVPLLVDVLLARHSEEQGAPRGDLRGMPLGLPALSAQDVQLVESWIAQGRPE